MNSTTVSKFRCFARLTGALLVAGQLLCGLDALAQDKTEANSPPTQGTPSVLPRPDFHFPGTVGRTFLDSDPARVSGAEGGRGKDIAGASHLFQGGREPARPRHHQARQHNNLGAQAGQLARCVAAGEAA